MHQREQNYGDDFLHVLCFDPINLVLSFQENEENIDDRYQMIPELSATIAIMKKRICIIIAHILLLHASSQTLTTDVLVVGGGIGGTAAGIQSARVGAKTIIIEETPWLGGMLSAAGVSAIDGNHELPSGLWGEFREKIYAHYGGASKVATGWVSNTHFEPHVADSILKSMARAEKNLTIKFQYRLVSVLHHQNKISGATFKDLNTGKSITIKAKQTIDATELGDVMALAQVPYSLGMEAGATTGETVGVTETNDIVQDITYVALLKDYGIGKDCTIAKPRGYDPREFDGACTDYYIDKSRAAPNVDAKKMLDYAKLPNGKYMLNWPKYGNDTYLNIVEMTPDQRAHALEEAKQTTLSFIYFIQTQLGFKHLGLTIDEFPTADRLALIPYHREGRRVKGLVRYTMTHIAKPFDQTLYCTGISVGDYPIDHHHKKNPKAPQQLEFYPVPSFNIPMATLIPEKADGLIVAEKGFSVTNVANGTTRLQPVVLLTGQAAGTIAALAAKKNIQSRQLSVREVQERLILSKASIMPYNDVKPSHPYFKAIQRIGATGILKGKPTPQGWANRTWFYPDSLVNAQQFIKDLQDYYPTTFIPTQTYVSMDMFVKIMQPFYKGKLLQDIQHHMNVCGMPDAKNDQLLTRQLAADLLDRLFNPFSKKINLFGLAN